LAQTQHQAFRAGNAWGVLFHAEADLIARSTPGFNAFADLISGEPGFPLDLVKRKREGDQRESNPHCRDHNAKFYR
jgi:hypothetical protein